MSDTWRKHADELRRAVDGVDTDALSAAAATLAGTLARGGTVLVAGNGGSASHAQHLSGELIGRLSGDRERGPLASVALTADTVVLTALANDYGYEEVFARQVETLGRAGDVLVLLSTSGGSGNLVRAADVARERQVVTVAVVGGVRRALHEACDVVVAVPSTSTQTIQEVHQMLVHVLVEMIEDELAAQ